MRKIISLFQRNYDGDRLVRNEVVPGAEWVLAGEGVATRKYDGTCCMIRDGKLYKRHEIQFYVDHVVDERPVYASKKDIPEDFEPACEIDTSTLKQQGWLPVGDGPEDRWHREAWANSTTYEPADGGGSVTTRPRDGTYELCGPKIQGNPEGYASHWLVPHDTADELGDCPRDFDGISEYLIGHPIEGIVWHHPDGRMVKIKAKDFGIKRQR